MHRIHKIFLGIVKFRNIVHRTSERLSLHFLGKIKIQVRTKRVMPSLCILLKGGHLYAVGGWIGKGRFALHPSEFPCIRNGLQMQTGILTRDIRLHCLIRSSIVGRLFASEAVEQESLDGCITSIRNGDTVEIVLSEAGLTALQMQEEGPLKPDWRFATIRDDTIVPKYWGTRYPLRMEAHLRIPDKLRQQLVAFLQEHEETQDSAFALVLQTSKFETQVGAKN